MQWLKRIFSSKRSKIQTFTYYIPAPPQRKTGYREKEFDSLFYEFINRGFEILEFKAIPHTGANHSGMWVIFAVRALTKEAEELDFELEVPPAPDLQSKISLKDQSLAEKTVDLPPLEPDMTEEVQGLYPIDGTSAERKSK